MKYVDTFAKELRDAREELRLSQRGLARLVGWSPAAISRYETGERKKVPARAIVQTLEESLDVLPGRLLTAAGYLVDAPPLSVPYEGHRLTAQEEIYIKQQIDFIRQARRSK